MKLTLLGFIFSVVTIKKCNAVYQDYRLGDFPSPDFEKRITVSAEDYDSFAEVYHNFNRIPFHVRVYAVAKGGGNAGFRFEGTGVCQNDGRAKGPFGGIIYGYNDKAIRIWVPSQHGAIAYVGKGWGGNLYPQNSTKAEVVVEAWKEGPDPSFQEEYELDITHKYSYNLAHGLRQLPEMVSILVKPARIMDDSAYHFPASSSSQTSSETIYGGVLYGYNQHNITMWTPNRKTAGCIIVSKYWGNGRFSSEVNSQVCQVKVRLWINSFPPPVFQNEWQLFSANKGDDSFIEIQHDLRVLPSLVKVLYRFPGDSQSLIFEGSGSVQSSEFNSNQYGGITYAYNSEKVRIWLPSSKGNNSFVIYVGNKWGEQLNVVKSVIAEIKVILYARRCFRENEIIDAQGYCRDTSKTAIMQVMTQWSDCSNPCSNGFKYRKMKGKDLELWSSYFGSLQFFIAV